MKKICSHCNGTGTIMYMVMDNPNDRDWDNANLEKRYDDCQYCDRGVVEIPLEKALDKLIDLVDHFELTLPNKNEVVAFTAYKEQIYLWVGYVKRMLLT